LLNKPLIRTR